MKRAVQAALAHFSLLLAAGGATSRLLTDLLTVDGVIGPLGQMAFGLMSLGEPFRKFLGA